MKKIKFLFTVMAVFFMSQVVSAQTSEWKEKTEFHKIMSQAFNKKIKSGASDEALKNDFMALHDTFHTIVGLCKAEDEHEH